jgi:hypothetical protein
MSGTIKKLRRHQKITESAKGDESMDAIARKLKRRIGRVLKAKGLV